ncbi:ATPase inhibitor subunit zeta [Methylobacterium sp. P5_C11]
MLRSFEERERAAELIYMHGEEMRFTNHIAAIRAVADLAIRMLGLDGLTSEAYAQALIAARIEGLKPAALLERVQADLAANGVEVSLAELEAEMARISAHRSVVDGQMRNFAPAHGLPPP